MAVAEVLCATVECLITGRRKGRRHKGERRGDIEACTWECLAKDPLPLLRQVLGKSQTIALSGAVAEIGAK